MEELQCKPLPHKYIEIPEWASVSETQKGWWETQLRIIYFDPSKVYRNCKHLIDPYKRIQSNLSLAVMFPKRQDGLCRCGCGKLAKRSWASKYCSSFANRVYRIICYGQGDAKPYVLKYHGRCCSVEGCEDVDIEIDHIIPVKHGGGGCWLSNYKPLCTVHHKDKTHKDFGWGKYKTHEKKEKRKSN